MPPVFENDTGTSFSVLTLRNDGGEAFSYHPNASIPPRREATHNADGEFKFHVVLIETVLEWLPKASGPKPLLLHGRSGVSAERRLFLLFAALCRDAATPINFALHDVLLQLVCKLDFVSYFHVRARCLVSSLICRKMAPRSAAHP